MLINCASSDRITDVSYRVQLLVVKSRIFAKANQPMKGFSLVLRAASTAERHGLVSALIEALRILGEILIELGEFNSAHTLLKAALPKVCKLFPPLAWMHA